MTAVKRILVATEVGGDADLVRRLLRDDFPDVRQSTDQDRAVADFESNRPDVLILAFNSLEKAERYYLGLYRLGTVVHALPHRTIILTNKDDLHRVYALCRKQYFDDYVLFWPVGHDAPRLPMAVHHAIWQLQAASARGPAIAEFATQARQLSTMEAQVEQLIARGVERVDSAREKLQSDPAAVSVLDDLAHELTQGDLRGAVDVKDATGLQRAINRLKSHEIVLRHKAVESAVEPVRGWARGLKTALAPGLAAIRRIGALAENSRPLVLLVDDDAFQHKLIERLLETIGCEMASAATGMDALSSLRHRRPQLILMDVQLPDIDGIEVTRRIRAVEQFAEVPILMITGQSDKAAVVESVKAGAAGFLVKPLSKEALVTKIQASLWGPNPDASPRANAPPETD